MDNEILGISGRNQNEKIGSDVDDNILIQPFS